MQVFYYMFFVAIFMGINSCTSQHQKVQIRYEELVAEFMAEQDHFCRQEALEEAKLSWSIETTEGEEGGTQETRLSKPGK